MQPEEQPPLLGERTQITAPSLGLGAALTNAPPEPATKAPPDLLVEAPSELTTGRRTLPPTKVVAPTPAPPVMELKDLEASTKIPVLRGLLNYVT